MCSRQWELRQRRWRKFYSTWSSHKSSCLILRDNVTYQTRWTLTFHCFYLPVFWPITSNWCHLLLTDGDWGWENWWSHATWRKSKWLEAKVAIKMCCSVHINHDTIGRNSDILWSCLNNICEYTVAYPFEYFILPVIMPWHETSNLELLSDMQIIRPCCICLLDELQKDRFAFYIKLKLISCVMVWRVISTWTNSVYFLRQMNKYFISFRWLWSSEDKCTEGG